MAAVYCGYQYGNHFPLCQRQRPGLSHQLKIKIEVNFHYSTVKAVDHENIVLIVDTVLRGNIFRGNVSDKCQNIPFFIRHNLQMAWILVKSSCWGKHPWVLSMAPFQQTGRFVLLMR